MFCILIRVFYEGRGFTYKRLEFLGKELPKSVSRRINDSNDGLKRNPFLWIFGRS
jgi:hypothetical protein